MCALNTLNAAEIEKKTPLLISNVFSFCLGGGGNTEVLFQTHPPSPIIQKTVVQTRMKWALQTSPVLMASVVVGQW